MLYTQKVEADRASLRNILQSFAETSAVKDAHEYNLLNSLIKSLSY